VAGIYIHIPFCKQKCHYCDFYFSTSLKNQNQLIDAICKELSMQNHFFKKGKINTIYLGGGTPSLLTNQQIEKIFNEIQKHYNTTKNPEVTIEANPDDLNKTKVKMLSLSPINRLSIGVQSFHNDDLKFLNRAHNSTQAISSIKNAQNKGFKNISIDLIYAIQTLSLEKWKKNLAYIKELELPHFSAYSLTVEKKTALYNFVKKGKVKPVNDNKVISHFKALQEFAKKNNYNHYEISNLCKKGLESKHNSSYWSGDPYLGVGPSAHSYKDGVRSWNISNNTSYIKSINKNVLPQTKEVLTNQNKFNEYVLTSLRTKKGCDTNVLKNNFSSIDLAKIEEEIERQFQEKTIQIKNTKLTLTKKGMLYADLIAEKFFVI